MSPDQSSAIDAMTAIHDASQLLGVRVSEMEINPRAATTEIAYCVHLDDGRAMMVTLLDGGTRWRNAAAARQTHHPGGGVNREVLLAMIEQLADEAATLGPGPEQ